ncbi:hypothetical protein L6R29_10265 [Myxococcota bacterium]|nr:hypothetical protein [Myxococcota bacterium]
MRYPTFLFGASLTLFLSFSWLGCDPMPPTEATQQETTSSQENSRESSQEQTTPNEISNPPDGSNEPITPPDGSNEPIAPPPDGSSEPLTPEFDEPTEPSGNETSNDSSPEPLMEAANEATPETTAEASPELAQETTPETTPKIPTQALLGPITQIGKPMLPYSPSGIYGQKPQIIGISRTDGSVDVAWLDQTSPSPIFVTHIRPDSNGYKAAWHLKSHSLGLLAGFARTENDHFLVLTAIKEDIGRNTTPNKQHRDKILQLVRLDDEGKQTYLTEMRTDLFKATELPVYEPLSFGTGRLAYGNNRFLIHIAQRTEYDAAVSQRHQIASYIWGNATTGLLTGRMQGISHSFQQRLLFDGTVFIGSALGDASLRGISMRKFSNQTQHLGVKTAFAVKGGSQDTGGGYNNTFSRHGQIAVGDKGYALLFSTENTDVYLNATNAARNLAFLHIVKEFQSAKAPDGNSYNVHITDTSTSNPNTKTLEVAIKDYWGKTFAGKNKDIAWLTQYTTSTEHAECPKIVRVGTNRYLVVWEKWTNGQHTSSFAMLVDEYGNTVKAAKDIGKLRLHKDDDAFALGDKAAWVIGAANPARLVLITVDQNLTPRSYDIP